MMNYFPHAFVVSRLMKQILIISMSRVYGYKAISVKPPVGTRLTIFHKYATLSFSELFPSKQWDRQFSSLKNK